MKAASGALQPRDLGRLWQYQSLLTVGSCVLVLACSWLLQLGSVHNPAADAGIIEVNIQDAVGGRMVTGAYSRFGWNHPGPLLFYALAPAYYLLGMDPIALHLGMALLNSLSVLAAVAVIRHLAGESAARWASLIALLFLLALSPASLSQIWNPAALAAPLFLFIILCAAAGASGRLAFALGAGLVGSFLVQTHVSTVGVVGVLLAATTGICWYVARKRGNPRPPKRRVALGASMLLALWLPPLLESAPAPPQNLLRLAAFLLRRDPGTQSLNHFTLSVIAFVRQAGAVPLGIQTFPIEVNQLDHTRLFIVCAGCVTSIVAAVIGLRRRNWFAVALATASLVGLGLGLVSVLAAKGPLLSYLFWWCAALPLPGWIALSVALAGRRIPPMKRRLLAGGMALTSLVLVGWFAIRVANTPISRYLDSRAAPQLAAVILERLPEVRSEGIELVSQESSYTNFAALYATLRRLHVDAVVPPAWAGNFGSQHLSGLSRPAPRHVAYLLDDGQLWNPVPTGLDAAMSVTSIAGTRVWLATRSVRD